MAPLAVVIAAFRPPAIFVDVVRDIIRLDVEGVIDLVIVVDDGSEPRYSDLFAAVASCPRVTAVRRNVNGGQGAALKTGMAHGFEQRPDLLGVVTADADGQHAPQDIVRVAQAFRSDPNAVVLGVRTFGRNVPLRSRFGNLLTIRLVRLASGLNVDDTQTGLRGWPRRCCERNLRNPATGFEFSLATLLDNAAAGETIVQVPIQTIYQPGNPTSHFRPVRDSVRIYRVLAHYALRPISRPPPS